MRVLHVAAFGVAVALVLGRRQDRGSESFRHRIRDYPRAVMLRTDQTGRSLLEGFQWW
jgi:hypothetical protein